MQHMDYESAPAQQQHHPGHSPRSTAEEMMYQAHQNTDVESLIPCVKPDFCQWWFPSWIAPTSQGKNRIIHHHLTPACNVHLLLGALLNSLPLQSTDTCW